MNECICLNFVKNSYSGEFISVGLAHFDGKMMRLATNIDRIKELTKDFEQTKTNILLCLRKLKREFDYTNKSLAADIHDFKIKNEKDNIRFGSVFMSAEPNADEAFKMTAELVLGPDYKRIDLFSSKDFVICDCVALHREDQPHYTTHHAECRHYDPVKDLVNCIDALITDLEFIALKYKVNVDDLYSYQKGKFVLTGHFPKIKESDK